MDDEQKSETDEKLSNLEVEPVSAEAVISYKANPIQHFYIPITRATITDKWGFSSYGSSESLDDAKESVRWCIENGDEVKILRVDIPYN